MEDLLPQEVTTDTLPATPKSHSLELATSKHTSTIAPGTSSSSLKLSFRRYGTLSPDAALVQDELHQREQQQVLRRTTTRALKRTQTRSVHTTTRKDSQSTTNERASNTDQTPDNTTSNSALTQFYGNLREDLDDAVDYTRDRLAHYKRVLRAELASLDYFRMSTMSFWAACISTPYFMFLYRIQDRVLSSSTTPIGVALRVISSFVASVPLNAAFFGYGSWLHHVTEWWALVQEWKLVVPTATLRQILHEVPFDTNVLYATTYCKWQTELFRTLVTSATLWIPINAVNFALVAPHMRPLILTVCSAFWNCYLSLAQHRQATILPENDDKTSSTLVTNE